MKFTTILVVLVSCLVLFSFIDYTDGSNMKVQPAIKFREPLLKSPHGYLHRNQPAKQRAQREFLGRKMIESVRQQRKSA